MERVFAYIDGFNLYGGLKQGNMNNVLWLDIQKLSKSLLHDYQRLDYTKYFTTRIVTHDFKKKKRQDTFIEALETLKDFEIIYGNFESFTKTCKFYKNNLHCINCNGDIKKEEEKKTDIKIAVEMISDAEKDLYDVALLISGDTDFIPVIDYIHSTYKNKRVIVGFPPNRRNDETAHHAKTSFEIGKLKLKNSLFDEKITNKWGYEISRPVEWL